MDHSVPIRRRHWKKRRRRDSQPAAALFQGLFADDNPYLKQLELRY